MQERTPTGATLLHAAAQEGQLEAGVAEPAGVVQATPAIPQVKAAAGVSR